MKRILTLAILLFSVAFAASAKLALPKVISDGMVLQQQTGAKIWGYASPGERVTVVTSWNKASYSAVASGEDGLWSVKVATPVASGNAYSITVRTAKETIVVKDVLIGEVWLCSGQSNMEMPMKGFNNQPTEGAIDYILGADPAIPLRMYNEVKRIQNTPNLIGEGEWRKNNPEAVANISAAAYFFGLYLQNVLKVPVGIVVSAYGGSSIEAWMDRETLEPFKADKPGYFDHLAAPIDLSRKDKHTIGCGLYNGMMKPLIGYTIKGMLWYQGCTNRNKSEEYSRLQPAFVGMLREQFDCGVWPFYYAQIAPFERCNPEFRSMQTDQMKVIENSGMISLIDVGAINTIHPAKKREVGERFAHWALSKTYNVFKMDCSGPVFKEMVVEKSIAYLYFDNAAQGNGLSPMNLPLDGFEVAGDGLKTFYPAEALVHTGKKAVKVWSRYVRNVEAVRYRFKHCPTEGVFLYDGYGHPASSFRTDNWEL